MVKHNMLFIQKKMILTMLARMLVILCTLTDLSKNIEVGRNGQGYILNK